MSSNFFTSAKKFLKYFVLVILVSAVLSIAYDVVIKKVIIGILDRIPDNDDATISDYRGSGIGLELKRENYSEFGRFGYVDKDGVWAVNPIFDDARPFSEERAAVCKDEKWGVINTKGEYIVRPQYKDIGQQFSSGLIPVSKDDKWGYIDTNGNTAIGFHFDEANDFHDDYASVKSSGKYGYINTEGKYIIKPQFDKAKNFDDKPAIVVNDGKYGVIDINGNYIVPLSKNKINYYYQLDNTALCQIYTGDGGARKYGVMDADGNIILETEYNDIVINNNIAAFKIDGNGKMFSYKFDTKGNPIKE